MKKKEEKKGGSQACGPILLKIDVTGRSKELFRDGRMPMTGREVERRVDFSIRSQSFRRLILIFFNKKNMTDAKEALRGLVMLLIAGACGADSSYFAGARKCGAAFSVLSIGAPPMAGVSLRCPTFLIPKTSSPRHAKGRPQLWRARPRPAGTLALFATDVAEGDGWGWRADTVEYGDFVKVHYTGFLEDGTEFENTREKEPLEFLVGSGRVVPGVDSAVAGMVLGERRSAKG